MKRNKLQNKLFVAEKNGKREPSYKKIESLAAKRRSFLDKMNRNKLHIY